MKITKIKIENFKSIKDIEFNLKKYGNSYTTMLVGINESGVATGGFEPPTQAL